MKDTDNFGVAPQAVLKGAKDLTQVFVVGRDKDGELYAAGSGPTNMHLDDIAAFKNALESGDFGD